MAYTKKVKGVSWNVQQFIWSNLTKVLELKSQGQIVAALETLIDAVLGMPRHFKDDLGFRAEALMRRDSLNKIRLGKLPELQREPDLFRRNRLRTKYLQEYCSLAFTPFFDKITSALDKRGYMEMGDEVDEGYSHTLRKERTRRKY